MVCRLDGNLIVADRQVSGWGKVVKCMSSAEIIGPRLHITEEGARNSACSGIAFGTVPVLQASVCWALSKHALICSALLDDDGKRNRMLRTLLLCLCVQEHTRLLHISNDSFIPACVSTALESAETPFCLSLQAATLLPGGQLCLQARSSAVLAQMRA